MFNKNKKAKTDFTIENLPSNRLESFWDIIRNHFSKILELGFILFVSSIPIIINTIITNINVVGIENDYSLGLITETDAINQIFSIYNISNLINIFLFLLIGFVLAGCIRIFRKLVWQEGLLFWQDFKVGIVQNYKPSMITLFIIGLLNFILQYLIRLLQMNPNLNGINVILAIVIVITVYMVPLSLMILVQTSIYDLPYTHKVKNGFLLAMRTAPKTFLFTIILIVPWSILLIKNNTFFLIALVVLFILFLPIEILGSFEYSISIFDTYINKDNYPTIYEKGIWK
ncbi:hypothetical protein ACAG96_00260 [Candidatus Izemoplasma sp. B36]|uniref:hypothetical protein n=1 Tax=Candidatus Izemoplasma sp. B36 TaxID=3242468 RepID=UPI0035565A41